MKIVANKFNNVVYKPTKEDVDLLVEECMRVIVNLIELERILVSEAEWFELGKDPDSLADEQLDVLELATTQVSNKHIKVFAEASAGATLTANRRLQVAEHYLGEFKSLSEEILLPYLPMTSEQVEKVRQVVHKIISELTFFIFYQFEFPIMADSFGEGELVVNVSIKSYVENNNIDAEELYEQISESLNTHIPTIGIFENFPTMLDTLTDMCGPYLMDLEHFEEYVTVEMIQDLLDGKIDPSELVIELEKLAREDK